MAQNIEQELASRGQFLFQTVGNSMEPMLHNRKSTVVIKPKRDRLKRYDVALYRRPTGEYVLHRVVKVLEDGYLICGDNRTWREEVPEGWVFGVMTGYYPTEENRCIPCCDPDYQCYLKSLGRRYRLLRLRELPARVWRRQNGSKR